MSDTSHWGAGEDAVRHEIETRLVSTAAKILPGLLSSDFAHAQVEIPEGTPEDECTEFAVNVFCDLALVFAMALHEKADHTATQMTLELYPKED